MRRYVELGDCDTVMLGSNKYPFLQGNQGRNCMQNMWNLIRLSGKLKLAGSVSYISDGFPLHCKSRARHASLDICRKQQLMLHVLRYCRGIFAFSISFNHHLCLAFEPDQPITRWGWRQSITESCNSAKKTVHKKNGRGVRFWFGTCLCAVKYCSWPSSPATSNEFFWMFGKVSQT